MWPFKRQAPEVKYIMQQRKFAAAEYTNLLSSWSKTKKSIDEELKSQGSALRNRAREAVKNNDYARRYLNILKTNVVGQNGIRLQCRAKNRKGALDVAANTVVETAWADFCRAVDPAGQLSMIGAQAAMIETAARDGELLIREIKGFPNKWGYALEFIDANAVDEQHNQELKNGNIIRLGIEYDKWSRPVAYHVLKNKKTIGTYSFNGRERQRIPAEQIIHAYRPEFANQSRGFTWMCAALVELHHLGHFQEAAIIAARMGASTMGFFTETAPDSFQGDDKNANGDLLLDAEPGSFRKLPAGVSFEKFESNYPSDMVDGFIKRSLKSIASGLNVNYNALASDGEGVSYGTYRGFSIDDRDYFRTLQNWLAETVLTRIYKNWLEKAIGSGYIDINKKNYQKMLDIKWQPRGWQWIDPAKDAKANETLLANKLTAPSIVVAEQGRDFEEVCQQIAADREIMKRHKIADEELINAN